MEGYVSIKPTAVLATVIACTFVSYFIWKQSLTSHESNSPQVKNEVRALQIDVRDRHQSEGDNKALGSPIKKKEIDSDIQLPVTILKSETTNESLLKSRVRPEGDTKGINNDFNKNDYGCVNHEVLFYYPYDSKGILHLHSNGPEEAENSVKKNTDKLFDFFDVTEENIKNQASNIISVQIRSDVLQSHPEMPMKIEMELPKDLPVTILKSETTNESLLKSRARLEGDTKGINNDFNKNDYGCVDHEVLFYYPYDSKGILHLHSNGPEEAENSVKKNTDKLFDVTEENIKNQADERILLDEEVVTDSEKDHAEDSTQSESVLLSHMLQNSMSIEEESISDTYHTPNNDIINCNFPNECHLLPEDNNEGQKISITTDIHKVWSYLQKTGPVDETELNREIHRKGAHQRNPMHRALQEGNLTVVESMLRLGASINFRDRQGQFPTHQAASSGNIELLDILIRWGGNLNQKDILGYTPLHRAALKGQTETVKWLLKQGAFNEDISWAGWTPLHLAALSGHRAASEILINRGAQINIKDNDGWTPLYLAKLYKRKEVIELLKARGGFS